jgi:hypothetical protein
LLNIGGLPTPIPENQFNLFRFPIENTESSIDNSQLLPECRDTLCVCKSPLVGMMGELAEIEQKINVLLKIEQRVCLKTISVLFIFKK